MMALERPTSARFFFNFISNDAEVIRDETGIVLSIEGDVVSSIACALEDLYRESSLAADEWQGWRMVVADDTGRTVLSLTLGGWIQEDGNLCPIPGDFKFLASTGMTPSAPFCVLV